MTCLLDTNILMRITDGIQPLSKVTTDAISWLVSEGETLYYLPQNIREFWNVGTWSADRNGLGFNHDQVEAEVERIEVAFTFLEDNGNVYREWRRLVFLHKVSGVQVHDCYPRCRDERTSYR